MRDSYSTYEAKARFSEILRKVRAGGSVFITYRGTTVAEVRPIDEEQRSLEERIEHLREQGVLGQQPTRRGRLEAIAERPGALKRFLEERD